jgi:hypothetical protein
VCVGGRDRWILGADFQIPRIWVQRVFSGVSRSSSHLPKFSALADDLRLTAATHCFSALSLALHVFGDRTIAKVWSGMHRRIVRERDRRLVLLGRVKVFGGHPGEEGRAKFGTHSTADNQDGLRLCACRCNPLRP